MDVAYDLLLLGAYFLDCRTYFRRDKTAPLKYKQKHRNYGTEARVQSGLVGLQPSKPPAL